MNAPPLRWIVVALIALNACTLAAQNFPKHWGEPPGIQTQDYRPLPGGYGHGSSTLAAWIQRNLDRDAAGKSEPRGVAVGEGVRATGELRQGRKVTLVIDGPSAKGRSFRVSVRLRHKTGAPDETFNVEQPSGPAGRAPRWLAQFTPEKAGEWTYRVSFREAQAPKSAEVEARSGRFSIASK